MSASIDKTVTRFAVLMSRHWNVSTEGCWPDHRLDRGKLPRRLDTNVLGVILSMKHEVRVMQKQGSGSIINISSTYGFTKVRYASFMLGGGTLSVLSVGGYRDRQSGIRERRGVWSDDTGMLTCSSARRRTARFLVTGVLMGRPAGVSLPTRSSSSPD